MYVFIYRSSNEAWKYGNLHANIYLGAFAITWKTPRGNCNNTHFLRITKAHYAMYGGKMNIDISNVNRYVFQQLRKLFNVRCDPVVKQEIEYEVNSIQNKREQMKMCLLCKNSQQNIRNVLVFLGFVLLLHACDCHHCNCFGLFILHATIQIQYCLVIKIWNG